MKKQKDRNYVKKYMDDFNRPSAQETKKSKRDRGKVKHKKQLVDYLEDTL